MGSVRVPIVPSAVLYDLGVGDPSVRPDALMGRTALLNAGKGMLRVPWAPGPDAPWENWYPAPLPAAAA